MTDSVAARADLSVVVVAQGSEAALLTAVRSVLTALDLAAHGVRHHGGWLRGERLGGEIVLVVRDVAALPAAVRRDRRVRVVAAPGVGTGRARNVGVAAARGRYLLFTSPDARVPVPWAVEMTTPLREGRADLTGGAVRLADTRPVDDALAAAVLGVVPDPPTSGRAFSGVSMAATRAVLESVGFDEALGTPRYPFTGDVMFRHDVVAAGFRELAVPGVTVERRPDPGALTPRALRRRAAQHARGAAYLDRHLRDARPHPARTLLGLVARAVVLAALSARLAPASARARAHAAVAYHRETLHLRHADLREPPRSAAGDAPGGAGAPRAASPVALVARDTVAPTALPPTEAEAAPAERDAVAPDGTSRGTAAAFWGRAPSRAATARAAAPESAWPAFAGAGLVAPLHGTGAS